MTTDAEQTTEQQLLAHATRQTEALESLRQFALVWTCIAGIGAAIWLIALIAAN